MVEGLPALMGSALRGLCLRTDVNFGWDASRRYADRGSAELRKRKRDMFKKAILFLLLAACGGSVDNEELGTLEQGVNAFKTPDLGFGTQTGNANLRCSLTSTSQICSVPLSKTMTYHVVVSATGFTNAEGLNVRTNVQGAATALGASWSHVTNTQDADVVIQKGTVSSGTLSNDIDGYVGVNFGTIAALSESSLPGSYQSHETATITLDFADASNKGSTSTEDEQLKLHMTWNAVGKVMGIGSQSVLTVNPGPSAGCSSSNCTFASRRAVSPFRTGIIWSAGEKCQVQNYAPTSNPGNMGYSNSVCPSN